MKWRGWIVLALFMCVACNDEANGAGEEDAQARDVLDEVSGIDAAERDTGAGDAGEFDGDVADAAPADATDTARDAAPGDADASDTLMDADEAGADALDATDIADADDAPDAADAADGADTEAGDATDSADGAETGDVTDEPDADDAPDVPAPEGTVNFDVTSVLVHDVVANNGAGDLDPAHDPMDRSGYVIMTDSAAAVIGGDAGDGVPDDAEFPAAGERPNIQLNWRNADDGPNGRVLLRDGEFGFDVPNRSYEQIEIYALSTEGPSDVDIVVHYVDGAAVTRTTRFADWFDDPAPSGFVWLIDGIDRYSSFDGLFDNRTDPAIAAYALNPDPERAVSRIVIAMKEGNQFVFFGSSGW